MVIIPFFLNYKAALFAIIHGFSKKDFTLTDYQRFKVKKKD